MREAINRATSRNNVVTEGWSGCSVELAAHSVLKTCPSSIVTGTLIWERKLR